jgi:hypothetical protein
MGSGQPSTNVTLRNDLMDLMEEIKFEELNLQADKIAPPVTVKDKAGSYPVLPREAIMKIPDTRRAPNGTYARGEWSWDQDSYTTRIFGYEEEVDLISEKENAQWISEEETSSQLAVQGLLLGRESRVAETLNSETIWTGSTNLHEITNAWDDATNADPIADIEAAALKVRLKSGMNMKMMTLIITDDVLNALVRCNKVKDDVKYTSFIQTLPQDQKAAWITSLFGLKKVIVVSGIYDTSGLNSTASIGRFWSNDYAFLGILSDGANTLKNRNAIRQLRWSAFPKSYMLESYEQPEKDARIIRAKEYAGIKYNTDYGILIKNTKGTVNSTTGF